MNFKNYLKNQEKYWDNRFEIEKLIWGEKTSECAKDAVKKFQNFPYADKILILGSAYGRNTEIFNEHGYDVDCLDISQKAIDLAKKKNVKSNFYKISVLKMDSINIQYDGIFGFNILHLFLAKERAKIINLCYDKLKPKGLIYQAVFSEIEEHFGNSEIEPNTYESKAGHLIHYFTEKELLDSFKNFEILDTGIIEEIENHGEIGLHTHRMRYIFAQK